MNIEDLRRLVEDFNKDRESAEFWRSRCDLYHELINDCFEALDYALRHVQNGKFAEGLRGKLINLNGKFASLKAGHSGTKA